MTPSSGCHLKKNWQPDEQAIRLSFEKKWQPDEVSSGCQFFSNENRMTYSSGSHIRAIMVLNFFIRVQEECIRVQEELVSNDLLLAQISFI